MIDFYYGYIYALIEVYAEIKDLPESEVVFDLLKSALKDFELEVRKYQESKSVILSAKVS